MTIGQLNIEGAGTIQIDEGLNLISFADAQLYNRVIQAIRVGIGDKIVYSENHQPKALNKVGMFLGDPVGGSDIKSYYSKFIPTILETAISDERRDKVYHLSMELQSLMAEEIIDSNLPFRIESEWNLEKIIKSQNITVEKSNVNTIFDKIEDIVHTMGMLNEERYLLLTNLSLYCDMSELNQLHQCLLAEGINLISLNLSRENAINDETFKASYIDQDFVLFT
ncbi:type II-A CRISPR-associated protein Csn2 [Fructobacillus cardui]|uniref:Type II-A CRISPR-associated protein Csn2 n=1 Tax=Fructobacillus cardui TaxID=2893170 RepID=A0ABM9MLR0_9LACO|nr:hypothetical protein R82641_BJNNKPBH_00039 [Fructobacillus cardui]